MILDPSLWGSYAGTFADWEEEGVTEPYYQTPDGKVTLLHGHVLDVLREMPAESVNCVVTSPPYWSLRKYDCEPVIWGGDPNCPHTLEAQPVGGESYEGKARWQHDGVSRQETPEAWVKESYVRNNDQTAGDKQRTNVGAIGRDSPIDHATCSLCGAWRGQYGLEPTPELYVEHTIDWLREVRRVLKPTGTVWLNIGDSYASGKGTCYNPGGGAESWETPRKEAGLAYPLDRGSAVTLRQSGLKPKDAVLMPFRVALAAQADGWWVRSVIIWHKPNPMPESVRDRPTDAHEYIFLLTRSKNYWYDADAIREPHAEPERGMGEIERAGEYQPNTLGMVGAEGVRRWVPAVREYNPAGRNCRSVWTFPTEPWPLAHFAVFPRELPTRCIKAGCPEWVCPKCGKARVRILETRYEPHGQSAKAGAGYDPQRASSGDHDLGPSPQDMPYGRASRIDTTIGWTDCGCIAFRCKVCYTIVDAIQEQRAAARVHPGQEQDLLLARPREGEGATSADAGDVSELRRELSGASSVEMLQPEVCCPASGERGQAQQLPEGIATAQLEGRQDAPQQRLHPSQGAGTSGGQQVGLRDGAPAGDGGGIGPLLAADGVCPPPERREGRQPPGEPGDGDEERPLRSDNLPPLQSGLFPPIACPSCGSSDFEPNPGSRFLGGTVLDPFAGSGTTCEVAYHLGRTAIGIDASAKYLDMAKERVKQGALL